MTTGDSHLSGLRCCLCVINRASLTFAPAHRQEWLESLPERRIVNVGKARSRNAIARFRRALPFRGPEVPCGPATSSAQAPDREGEGRG